MEQLKTIVEVISEESIKREKYTFVNLEKIQSFISSTRNDTIFIHFLLKNRKMNTREHIISTINVVYMRFDVSMGILT